MGGMAEAVEMDPWVVEMDLRVVEMGLRWVEMEHRAEVVEMDPREIEIGPRVGVLTTEDDGNGSRNRDELGFERNDNVKCEEDVVEKIGVKYEEETVEEDAAEGHARDAGLEEQTVDAVLEE